MKLLYNLSINLYWVTIKLASVSNHKAKKWILGRKNWKENLQKQVKPKEDWIWVHCSSHGEFEDCAQILKGLRKEFPNHKTLLTFFSPSGMEAIQSKNVADLISYMPFDSTSNAKAFLDILQPKAILFSRSELWYNFLSETKRREIPTFLIAALVDSKSAFLKWPQKNIYKKCYSAFTQIYTQNETTKALLKKELQIDSCTVTGNPRIDQIYSSLNNQSYPLIEQFKGNAFCVIGGSTLEKDEAFILSVAERLKDLNIKWLIAPHEIDRKKIDGTLRANSQFISYSGIESANSRHKVLYLDFVGGLKHIYQYSDIAIIGGGFNRIGIHNIIEPSFHGVPTLFGPNHRNYPEALELLELGHSQIFKTEIELENKIRAAYNRSLEKKEDSSIENYAHSKRGATEKIMDNLLKRLS